MSAETQDTVKPDYTDWVQACTSTVGCHVFIVAGEVGIIAADAKPSSTINVEDKGVKLSTGDSYTLAFPSTLWVRATFTSSKTVVSPTTLG